MLLKHRNSMHRLVYYINNFGLALFNSFFELLESFCHTFGTVKKANIQTGKCTCSLNDFFTRQRQKCVCMVAVVIQCVESPSGINMRRDARLELDLHKDFFFCSSRHISMCVLRANMLVCKGGNFLCCANARPNMQGSCSVVSTRKWSK